ncbi:MULTISPECIES: flavodoxin family protein [unclassified Mesorhizobium]|uniref:flavodoxin family protein n=1 Tax=unclassified Mesorhizobium TaxID=325217 RepID=UPI000F760437|nr:MULTISPECIES: flavodoxin family protein [unclassified Mesorhizobium]AZO28519.1 flavodoxin family protein [Mesorhizobium sp. M1B.F.Ca.ET.045.04.1.1]RWD99074.1 MAG: flavodoxin family protein [Mesorhizobium sp.]TIS43939.1 MAG: flavodoxin family protein [Mesorhizobium sp.]
MAKRADFSKAGPEPRKGMPSPRLSESDFKERYRRQFYDPAFRPEADAIGRLAEIAWQAYTEGRKSPITRKAGQGFHNPDYDLSVEWIAAHEAVEAAKRRYEDKAAPSRILLINGSSRSEHTCPGEMSKSFRLVELARTALAARRGFSIEILDLARLASEYGRRIFPCKACFSTAAALCHWPCSCYPNHSLGQVNDWMNEIYPLWVEAHGVMIVTPVNWYQTSSPVKLMMDRLVCADGGNPDPSQTQGKDAALAKKVELAGWDYPRHLAGRLFSVIVHGDTEGAGEVGHSLADWLRSMKLDPVGEAAELDRYIGYWKPYATSHDELDADHAVQAEVRNAALALAEAIEKRRAGSFQTTGIGLEDPRPK